MSTATTGEIRMFAGTFAPVGWLLCDGQVLPITEYETLYTLIGTTYGGDGQDTFALPNLQSRIPLGQSRQAGNAYQLGEIGGVESVTLTAPQMPSHTHPLLASTAPATTGHPAGKVVASAPLTRHYAAVDVEDTTSAMRALDAAGGSQPHENRQPSLCVNFIICHDGVYPTPSGT